MDYERIMMRNKHLDNLICRYPRLQACADAVYSAYEALVECYARDNKLLIAGNGGSAADSEHIMGELMKSFKLPRPIDDEMADRICRIDPVQGKVLVQTLQRGLATIPLVAHEALSTAYINDVDAESLFAQQLLGIGRPGDVFLGISTSGNSQNIINAMIVAKAMDMKVIGLTGIDGGALAHYADIVINAPERETYLIQEYHLPIYHCICMMLEEYYFGKAGDRS